MVTPLIVAKAYAAAAQNAGASLGAGGATAGPDFGQMVSSVMHDAVGASRNAETQMANQMQGKANLVDVVTAISSAETSLQTVMAVRDQMIAAYKEVMSMAI